jgi:hypothetical protein
MLSISTFFLMKKMLRSNMQNKLNNILYVKYEKLCNLI